MARRCILRHPGSGACYNLHLQTMSLPHAWLHTEFTQPTIRLHDSTQRMRGMNRLRFVCVAFVLLALVACKPAETGSSETTGTGAAAAGPTSIQINGARATFPYPIYSECVEAYGQSHP